MPLPNFLIIGSMKCGTTTLHRDLSFHPDIYMSENKEPESLGDDFVLSKAGLKAYEGLFTASKTAQMIGEASTAYTKYPDYTCIPERAKKVLGDDIKLIFMFRDPLKRLKSHYLHDFRHGEVGEDYKQKITTDSSYAAYSRYKQQLELWLEIFDEKNLGVWRFEDYISDKGKVLGEIIDFLGLDSEGYSVDDGLALNVGEDKVVANSFWKRIVIENKFYQNRLKKYIPWKLRQQLASLLLSKNKRLITIDEHFIHDTFGSEFSEDIEFCERLMSARRG